MSSTAAEGWLLTLPRVLWEVDVKDGKCSEVRLKRKAIRSWANRRLNGRADDPAASTARAATGMSLTRGKANTLSLESTDELTRCSDMHRESTVLAESLYRTLRWSTGRRGRSMGRGGDLSRDCRRWRWMLCGRQ